AERCGRAGLVDLLDVTAEEVIERARTGTRRLADDIAERVVLDVAAESEDRVVVTETANAIAILSAIGDRDAILVGEVVDLRGQIAERVVGECLVEKDRRPIALHAERHS